MPIHNKKKRLAPLYKSTEISSAGMASSLGMTSTAVLTSQFSLKRKRRRKGKSVLEHESMLKSMQTSLDDFSEQVKSWTAGSLGDKEASSGSNETVAQKGLASRSDD